MNKLWNVIVVLCIGYSHSEAQLPDEIKTELSLHLDTLSQGWIPSHVERTNEIFELYENEPLAGWEDFFGNYFLERNFTNDLHTYLIDPTFFILTEKVRSNLQGGLFTALSARQDTLWYNTSDLSTKLSTDIGYRNSLVNINKFFNRYFKYPGNTAQVYFPAMIDYYLQFIQNNQNLLAKPNQIQLDKYPFLGIIRSQIYANLASYNYLDKSQEEAIAAAIGLHNLETSHQEDLWQKYHILLSDNGLLDERQLEVVLQVLNIIPASLHQVVNLNVTEVIHEDPNAVSSIGGVNLYNYKVGELLEDGFPSETEGAPVDLFTLALLHELSHNISNYALKKNEHFLEPYRLSLLESAGNDQLNYLRSINGNGFFLESPDELFASTANMYFASTQLTYDIALQRMRNGRHQPMDQFLFLANTLSNGTDSILFINFDMEARFNVQKFKVAKDADGFITTLWLNDMCAFDFILDENKFVQEVIEPMRTTEILDNGIDEDCDGADLTTATYDFGTHIVKIYPNPTTGLLHVDAPESLNLRYQLYNMQGRLISAGVAVQLIDPGTLDQGIYILKLTDQRSGQSTVERVSIIH